MKIFVVQTNYYDDNSVEFVTTNLEHLIDYIVSDEGYRFKVENVNVGVWKNEINLYSNAIYRVADLYNLLKLANCDLSHTTKLLEKEEQYRLNEEKLRENKLENKEYKKYLELKSKYENT